MRLLLKIGLAIFAIALTTLLVVGSKRETFLDGQTVAAIGASIDIRVETGRQSVKGHHMDTIIESARFAPADGSKSTEVQALPTGEHPWGEIIEGFAENSTGYPKIRPVRLSLSIALPNEADLAGTEGTIEISGRFLAPAGRRHSSGEGYTFANTLMDFSTSTPARIVATPAETAASYDSVLNKSATAFLGGLALLGVGCLGVVFSGGQRIHGIDSFKDSQELSQAIEAGGRFVRYSYVLSFVLYSVKCRSRLHFIPPGGNATLRSYPFTLFTFLFGWWGIPWGPIYTAGSLVRNLRGGYDQTAEVLAQFAADGVLESPGICQEQATSKTRA